MHQLITDLYYMNVEVVFLYYYVYYQTHRTSQSIQSHNNTNTSKMTAQAAQHQGAMNLGKQHKYSTEASVGMAKPGRKLVLLDRASIRRMPDSKRNSHGRVLH
jgi:hypothetical protein